MKNIHTILTKKKRSAFLLSIILVSVFFLIGKTTKASEPGIESGYYVFVYFMNNGADGFHYAVSRDGYCWKALNGGKAVSPTLFGEGKTVVRDPSIIRSPDGFFHCVWTAPLGGRAYGYAKSNDLINWKDVNPIDSMSDEPTCRNTWAPDLFYDNKSDLFYVIWSSTIPGRFSPVDVGTSEEKFDHRLYYHTTRNFQEFSSTKLYYEPGRGVIDGNLIERDGVYYLFFKDETLIPEPDKSIYVATSKSPIGPFENRTRISKDKWAEGPSALKIGKEILVYYDYYANRRYGASRSQDGITWENIDSMVSFPQGVRHGSAFEIDQATYERLVEHFGVNKKE